MKRTNPTLHTALPGRPLIGADLKDDDVLWRYLDTAKYFDLLHTKSLHLTRGDGFPDRFEGSFTRSTADAIQRAYASGVPGSFDQFAKSVRESAFISCWHRGIHDNVAMWGMYGRSPFAVAVTTTVVRLASALAAGLVDDRIYVKSVTYTNHWKDPKIFINPYSNVFAYKTVAYKFENEVRVIVDRHSTLDTSSQAKFIKVPVNLNELFRSVVVSPDAPEWYVTLIKGVTPQFGAGADVKRSMLAVAQTY